MKIFGYQITKIAPLLSENKRAIEWAEAIVLNSNYRGEVSRDSFMPDWFLSDNPPTKEQKIEWRDDKARQFRNQVMASLGATGGGFLDLDKITRELIKYLELVKKFLLHEGYIQEPRVTETFWKLTPRGKKMKELGGHQKYKDYYYSITHAHLIQFRVNLALIFVTFLAAVMPFVVAKVFPPKVTVNYPAQGVRQDIRIDSVWLRQQVDGLIQEKLSNQTPKEPTKEQLPKKGGK